MPRRCIPLPLPDESVQTGDVVEIDTGLAQFFLLLRQRTRFLSGILRCEARIQDGKAEDTEVS